MAACAVIDPTAQPAIKPTMGVKDQMFKFLDKISDRDVGAGIVGAHIALIALAAVVQPVSVIVTGPSMVYLWREMRKQKNGS